MRPAVRLRTPGPADADEFLARVQASRALHHPWVYPPRTGAAFRAWLERLALPTHRGYFVCVVPGGEIAAVLNLSEIVRGGFRSAYLGYYAFVPYAGLGYVTAGMCLLLATVFGELGLHRLEANVQPGNARSRALVQRLGFRCEGFSPRYLKVGGRWRDHERWALLADEWPATARRRRPVSVRR
jgi:ribosomal-protein-alanine N-acetyltransferase